jgi:hypothetical protein
MTPKVAEALRPLEQSLWVIGSNMRRLCLKTNSSSTGYDFLTPTMNDGVIAALREISCGSSVVELLDGGWRFNFDMDAFDVSLFVMPVEDFLLTARFAGDSMAMKVTSQQCLCRPHTGLMPLNTPLAGVSKDEIYDEQHYEVLQKDAKSMAANIEKEIAQLWNSQPSNKS